MQPKRLLRSIPKSSLPYFSQTWDDDVSEGVDCEKSVYRTTVSCSTPYLYFIIAYLSQIDNLHIWIVLLIELEGGRCIFLILCERSTTNSSGTSLLRRHYDERGYVVRLIDVDCHRFVKDRKSTRLNSSHQIISYAVFCLKK